MKRWRSKMWVWSTLLLVMLSSCSAKIKDNYLLSKCQCKDTPNKGFLAECDFSSLSKSKLVDLVTRLQSSRIICIDAEGTAFATFSSSLYSFIPKQSIEDDPKRIDESQRPQKSVDRRPSPTATVDTPPVETQCDATKQQLCNIDDALSVQIDGVHLMYPTTIISDYILSNERDRQHNAELRALLLNLESTEEGSSDNLHDGYRTTDGFLQRDEASIQWLVANIHPRVRKLLSLSNSTNIAYEIAGWGAVLRGQDSHKSHVHPGSIFAGVYYVSVPPEIARSGKSHGCLLFHDPRPGAQMAQAVRGRNFYGYSFDICPESEGGLLVLFPSWLMHEVRPMLTSYTGPRIAVSFNVFYTHSQR